MPGLLTNLPPVQPLVAQNNLTFTEFNRVIQSLLMRDRVLEESFLLALTNVDITNLNALLAAVNVILGAQLIASVETTGALPADLQEFDTFQRSANDQLATLNDAVIAQDAQGNNRSIKSLTLNNQASIAALTAEVDGFQAQLASIEAVTSQIASINTFVAQINQELADTQALVADVAEEVKNARAQFATDPSKRLIDEINSLTAVADSTTQTLNALVQEVTTARSPDRFDTLAERLGSIESTLQSIQTQLTSLTGNGTVTGIKVGRSILHGDVEFMPGGNIAITRERNGYRVDVVDNGTCVDLAAAKIDPNNGQCGPRDPNFGN